MLCAAGAKDSIDSRREGLDRWPWIETASVFAVDAAGRAGAGWRLPPPIKLSKDILHYVVVGKKKTELVRSLFIYTV